MYNKEAVRKWAQKNRAKRTEYRRKYRATKRGKLVSQEAVNRYRGKHPERIFAWNEVKKIKRKPCVKCGAKIVHRHHPDISQPLKIVFLCPLHHKQEHMV